jgi:hypothetical protein
MDRVYIIATLRFWDAFPDERKTGEAAEQLQDELRATVEKMDMETRVVFGEIARRQYGEQEATKASVTSRASTLLFFVGVITTGTTLVATSLPGTHVAVAIAMVVVGVCLLYAGLAVAFLSVRAQEVSMWTAPEISATEARNVRVVTVADAVEHAFSYAQNEAGVRHLVAYLADAQRWARRAVILVVVLAALSVAAAATKPPSAGAASSTPTAVPSPSATPTPSAIPSPSAKP